jgi:bacterioferritin-associated ferredoxin
MYVCICNAVRECELRQVARACPGGADKIYAALGVEPQCGQCLDEAEELIAAERRRTRIEALASL